MTTTVDISDTVETFLLQRQRELGFAGTLGPQTAIFGTGLLDSVSLMDLVVAVETASGQTIDMLFFDPASVETLDDLQRALTAALSA